MSKIRRKFLGRAFPLLSNYAISLAGDSIYLFAINWFLVSQTQTTSLLGLINGVSSFVLLVANFLAGPIVDRYNRKKLLIFSDLLSFFACLICSITLNDYVNDRIILIITTSILSISMAINSPSAKAIVPNVISSEKIEKFNSIQNTLSSVIKIVSPLLGAFILSLYSSLNLFIFINSISFLLSALLILTVPYNEIKKENNVLTFTDQFFSGLKYINQKKRILGILVFISVLNFIMTSYGLVIPYLINVLLDKSEKVYSFLVSLEAIGGIIGGVLLTYKSSKVSKISFISDIKYLSLILLIVGIIHNLYLLCFCSLVNGFFLVQINAKVFTIIQKETKKNYLGRVFSILFIFSSLLIPPANFIFGRIVPFLKWNTFIFCSVGLFITSYIIIKNFIKE